MIAAGLCIAACVTPGARAQVDLGKQLSKVVGRNAVEYVSPLLSGWGAALNSGVYHSADLHDILGFDIGLKVSAMIVREQEREFDFELPQQIRFGAYTFLRGVDYDAVVRGAPTAVGARDGAPVKVRQGHPLAGQTIFTTPPGYDLQFVPLVVPQASVGLPFGLEVIGRFIPQLRVGDAGKVNFLGFGLRHDLDQYFSFLPLDLAVHFMTQKFTLNDGDGNKVLAGNATAYGIEISKKLAALTFYGGFQLEKSSWDVEPYAYLSPETRTSERVGGFSVEGKNASRVQVGFRLLLLFVNVHADYSFAAQPVATVGVGATFR
jgi:hypothetical protein